MIGNDQFVADLYPSAQKISQESGMSWELILAQAAQETGWGKKVLPGTHNIFNIKASGDWQGATKTFNVWEIENGKMVWKDQSFRSYESVEEALRDRVKFLQENPRYANAGLFDQGTLGNFEKEADALQKGGYATDPNYAQNLKAVFNGPTMQRGVALAEGNEIQATSVASVPIQNIDTHYRPGDSSINRAGDDFASNYAKKLSMTSTYQLSQTYHLNITGSPALLSVLKFSGNEALSTPYRFVIDVTSPVADLATASILGQAASFTIQPIDVAAMSLASLVGDLASTLASPSPARIFHGLITQFDQLSTSADQTHYRLTLEPRVADLSREVTSRLFQQQSAPEILEAVLRHAGFTATDFQFTLRTTYPTREYTTQYEETTLEFLQRIAADEGIWFRFTQTDDREVIVFGDDLDAYDRSGLTAHTHPDAGLESAGIEAIKSLTQQRYRVTQSVRLNDDNHRTAGVSLLTDANVARDDSTTAGTDYRWGDHQKDPDDAQRIAKLRHQAHLTKQVIYDGTGNVLALAPGSVLQLSDKTLPDAPHGLLITKVTHEAARDRAYSNDFDAIPADRSYCSQPLPWPRISGLLPARIMSPGNYKYAYLNADGEYRVQLPFDLDSWSPGGTSRPVRLAKPYSGRDYGHHFPLIDGAEVILGFTQGDPDRPYIVGAVHNTQRTDLVTNQNNTRNLIRTAAQNELRMEDREGIEHIHLTTPTQTSELNLGHIVDRQNNERGIGAELRTDGHASVRAAKGVFISADAQPGANGQQLEMQDAGATLQQANDILRTLNDSANTAKAWLAEIDQQRALIEQKLTNLQKPVIVANAPEGLGIASGQHMQLAARKQMFVTAGDGLDIGVIKRITLAAGDAISFFAQKLGIRLLASQGKVQIQAQGDAMELMALKNIAVSSSTGEVIITASKGITLGDGSGAYVKIANGKIEIASPSGDVDVKGNVNIDDPASGRFTFPNWSDTPLKDMKHDMNFGFSG